MTTRQIHRRGSGPQGRIAPSPLQVLSDRIRARFPAVESAIDAALDAERGVSILDLLLDDQRVTVGWSSQRGFGVSSRNDIEYGEGPDEIFDSVEDAAARIVALLLSHTHTAPPAPAGLAELRQRLGFTQVALAKRMGVKQASISKLERREDTRLSTLGAYMKAMGSKFQVVATTPIGVFPLKAMGRAKKAKSGH